MNFIFLPQLLYNRFLQFFPAARRRVMVELREFFGPRDDWLRRRKVRFPGTQRNNILSLHSYLKHPADERLGQLSFALRYVHHNKSLFSLKNQKVFGVSKNQRFFAHERKIFALRVALLLWCLKSLLGFCRYVPKELSKTLLSETYCWSRIKRIN